MHIEQLWVGGLCARQAYCLNTAVSGKHRNRIPQ